MTRRIDRKSPAWAGSADGGHRYGCRLGGSADGARRYRGCSALAADGARRYGGLLSYVMDLRVLEAV